MAGGRADVHCRGTRLSKAVGSMGAIADCSRDIGQIIDLIDAMRDRTRASSSADELRTQTIQKRRLITALPDSSRLSPPHSIARGR
jgi:hypothetical protein